MMSSPTGPVSPVYGRQLRIEGAVQGVGFRPFVYRLAQSLELTGWICNTNQGVLIEIEGTAAQLQAFETRLPVEKPTHAYLQTIEVIVKEAVGYQDFTILASDLAAEQSSASQAKSALILPDLATCPECLADIFNPANRHFRYPFTNCTHCGPRFSILHSLPYDRPHTTLRGFPLCPACQTEYHNPRDRRFHAQPNACPDCGPQLELWQSSGAVLASRDQALQQAAEAVRQGQILALKGLGGFHLVVDARNDGAVRKLRDRKHRPHQPFAVMAPSLDWVKTYCQVSPLAAELLQSAAAPILLLPLLASPFIASKAEGLAAAIAPGSPYLGVMLPYTPLHHLLLAELGFPIVATSGNRSGEPICIDELEAIQTLGKIADVFLVHNRPIARPIDDSIAQIVDEQTILLRRARGYAPFPIFLPPGLTPPSQEVILAVGSQLKNTVALSVKAQIFVSQHLGDLEQVQTGDRFQAAIEHLCSLYHLTPTIVVCDAHPDYYSSQFAQAFSTRKLSNQLSDKLSDQENPAPPVKLIRVQHHYAHVLSCLVDNQWQPPVLGVAWDGTGYGLDGTIWGGEWLWLPADPLPEPGFLRLARLRPFPLPGGNQAIKEPRRCALGLLYESLGEEFLGEKSWGEESWGESVFESRKLPPLQSFSDRELAILKTMLQQGLNTPITSSMGRLFDAIAALLGLCFQASFEGQAAMQLEFAIAGYTTEALYPYALNHPPDHLPHQPIEFDYAPMVKAMVQDLRDRVSPAVISATFHNTLVAALVEMAVYFRNQSPEMEKIVLTGGCFQNRYLLERACDRLRQQGFLVGHHRHLPSNDGGISTGQIVAARRFLHQQTLSTQQPTRSQPECV